MFFIFVLFFFIEIGHVFINKYSNHNSFFDLPYCFFVFHYLNRISYRKNISFQVFDLVILSIITGLLCDLCSINTMGITIIIFLVFSVFLLFFSPFVIHGVNLFRFVFFVFGSIVFQILSYLLLLLSGDIRASVFSIRFLLQTALVNGVLLFIIFLTKKYD